MVIDSETGEITDVLPFENKLDIVLYGEQESQSMFLTNAIEAGNKVLMNINKVIMKGKPVTTYNTRLQQEANAGDNFIYIETGLTGWDSGHILLAPTSTSYLHSEYV